MYIKLFLIVFHDERNICWLKLRKIEMGMKERKGEGRKTDYWNESGRRE